MYNQCPIGLDLEWQSPRSVRHFWQPSFGPGEYRPYSSGAEKKGGVVYERIISVPYSPDNSERCKTCGYSAIAHQKADALLPIIHEGLEKVAGALRGTFTRDVSARVKGDTITIAIPLQTTPNALKTAKLCADCGVNSVALARAHTLLPFIYEHLVRSISRIKDPFSTSDCSVLVNSRGTKATVTVRCPKQDTAAEI